MKARGWCFKHYERWRQHGDPSIVLKSAGPPEHGTVTMYTNHGCRCDACREANTAYVKERKIAGYAEEPCPNCGKPKRVPSALCQTCQRAEIEAPHGSEARYKRCHCEKCRAAATAERRRRRHETRVPCSHGCGTMVDSTGRRNPEKPPECRPCSLKRIHAERRERRAMVAA